MRVWYFDIIQVMDFKKEFKVKVLQDEKIPESLRELPDAPGQLHLIGDLPERTQYKYLTVVGSRVQSAYGRRVLESFIAALAGLPVVIVSGLALGTDAHAHKLALQYGLKTIAVPGSGLSKKVLYPKSHFNLAKQILDSGGALLSEFDFEQQAAPWTFPQRNRIMAGLSDATLVIEAKEKSGTLITARLASEYNKDLLVVPGDIFQDSMRGNLQFLKLGATPVCDAQDILEVLDINPDIKTPEQQIHGKLPDDERVVLNALSEPLDKDALLQKSGLEISRFNIAFSKLELKGLLKEELGKVFRI